MGDDQGFWDRLKELQLRLIYEQKTTDATTVTMAMARLEVLASRPAVAEGWVEIRDTDAVCVVCRWRADHAPDCPRRDEPWPTIKVPAAPKP